MKSFGIFLLSFVLAFALQYYRGAYHHDLAGDPDEPAHAVTSLMLREYLVEGWGISPKEYFANYYERYAKVALGHYPPIYYLIGAGALLVFPSATSLLVLQALINAAMAVLTFRIGTRFMNPFLALSAAIAWLFIAQVQRFTASVMADQLVALLTLASAYAFYLFVIHHKLRYALGFGFLASLTILTKGSGWYLGMLPGLVVLATNQWRLVFNWRLWTACLPVLFLAVPWQWYSSRISKEGFQSTPLSEYYKEALPFYLSEIPSNLGWILTIAFFIPILLALWHRPSRRHRPLIVVLFSTVIVVVVMMAVVPTGLTSRYLIPIFAPCLLLAAYCIQVASERSVASKLTSVVAFGLLTLASLYPTFTHRDVSKHIHGFEAALDKAQNYKLPNSPNLMVISDPRGEGAVISRAAFTAQDSRQIVSRASKVIADMDWLGRNHTERFSNSEELLTWLSTKRYSVVLFDRSTPEKWIKPHFRALDSALRSEGSGWTLTTSLPVQRSLEVSGQIELWVYKSGGTLP